MKKKKHDGWCLLTPSGKLRPIFFWERRSDTLDEVVQEYYDPDTSPEGIWNRLQQRGYKIVPVRLVEVK